jgi:TolB-like protein/DNA-binding winged helix-turn-helix (wHTH) protein/tetratricopeptide (TPR) repeat protein
MTDNNKIFSAGAIHLDIARERLTVHGEAVALRRKPMLLLYAMMSRAGELLSKRELIDIGWGDVPVTDAVLATAVKEIRRALGDDARAPRVVENVHGRGYRFLLDVDEVRAPSPETRGAQPPARPEDPSGVPAGDADADGALHRGAIAASPETVPTGPGAATTQTSAPPPPTGTADRPRSLRGMAGWIGIAVFATVAVLLWSTPPWKAPRGPAGAASLPENAVPAPSDGRPSIAVLPLADMSPGGDRGWFADGLTEEILNELARSPDLLVASRTSAFRFRDGATDVREIGRELGVEYVMEGSVRSAADRLRITVQLIRADDGLHVFSESWDRPFALDSVLGVQQEISRRVLTALNATLAPRRGQSSPIVSGGDGGVALDAYEDFLRGRELVRSRTPEGLTEGLALLNRSVEAAPDYAPAHAAIALGSLFSASYLGTTLDEAMRRANAHLRIARALAPDSEEALTAASLLAMAEGDDEASLEFANAAVATVPSSAEAHYRRGVALFKLGYLQEALDAARRASLLDPLSLPINSMLSSSYMLFGMPEEAIALARRTLRHNPDSAIALATLGELLARVGDYSDACRYLYAALERAPDAEVVIRHHAELLWRLGADDPLLDTARPSAWAARAAVLLERGQDGEPLALARANREYVLQGLDAQDIAYWAGDLDLARELARRRLGVTRPLEREGPFTYSEDFHQLIALLGDEVQMARLNGMLRERFADWAPAPGDMVLPADLYGAAAWRLLEGDASGALAPLELAAERGYVLRELRLDPLFDGLREMPRFVAVLETMAATAAAHRDRVPGTLRLTAAPRDTGL